MTDLKSIPMLYKHAPFDAYHAQILNLLQQNKVTYRDATAYFDMPGIGFHRSLWLLSLHCVEHRRQGQQTFVIPTGMQKALGRTSLAEVTVDDLRFPFSSFYVALPSYDREIWGGTQTQWHEIRGAFLWIEKGRRDLILPDETHPVPDNDRGILHIYIWGAENERSQHRGDDASLWTSLDLNEMHKHSDDLEGYLDRILRDPDRERHDTFQDDPQLADLFGFTFLPRTGDMRDKQIDSVLNTLRIIFNTMLYMDTDDAELEVDPSCVEADLRLREIEQQLSRMKNHKKGRARKLKREAETIPTDTVTWVGRSISKHSGTSNGSGTAQRRHWVRGHWWPRRDTIRRRILDLEGSHEEVLREYQELRESVANASSPEEASPHLSRLAFVRGKAQKAESDIAELRERMEGKRRWVKPYQKGSRGSTPDTHTYVLGT